MEDEDFTMKTNFHTHTARCCHASGRDEEYVQSAIRGGYQILGFADHSPWQFSSSYTIPGLGGRFDANLLQNTALLEPEKPAKKYTLGWHRDSLGWWYADTAASYYKDRWAKLGGHWYYFDEKGYMLMDTWKVDSTGTYYLGEDGKMLKNRLVGIGADGKLRPMERYYHLLSDLPDYYRKEIDPLVAAGKLKGKSGEGENLVLDMSEGTLRAVIVGARE